MSAENKRFLGAVMFGISLGLIAPLFIDFVARGWFNLRAMIMGVGGSQLGQDATIYLIVVAFLFIGGLTRWAPLPLKPINKPETPDDVS